MFSLSRTVNAIFGVAFAACSFKLYMFVVASLELMIHDNMRPPLALTISTIAGAWACATVALDQFRKAFKSEQTGET